MSALPRATYRLQLGPGLGFEETAALVPYLAELGATHVYCSPIFAALPQSRHGYDVVDYGRLRAELGGEPGFERLLAALKHFGLRLVLDLVPNHMAASPEHNRWWRDVLEHGQASRYAGFFDIDWEPGDPRFRGALVLPLLEIRCARALAEGVLALALYNGLPALSAQGVRLPLSPRSLAAIVASLAQRDDAAELCDLGRALNELAASPARTTPQDRSVSAAADQLKERLRALLEARPALARALETLLKEINADPQRLGGLLAMQHYRLGLKRSLSRVVNYRRFCDVNELAALSVEQSEVFDASHSLVKRLVEEGVAEGLRIDHVDGLNDPQGYLERLRALAPKAWIVVEKILAPGEELPASWPVNGTTGYDFLHAVSGLFVAPWSEPALTRIWREFTGEQAEYRTLVRQCKLAALENELAADLERLSRLFQEVAESRPELADCSATELRGGLAELLAAFPVYRSYLLPEGPGSPRDREVIAQAVAAAQGARPDLPGHLFEFLGAVMGGEVEGWLERELALRLQQLSGPAMVVGVENTVFYRFNRMAALNELGGDPGRWPGGVAEFHEHCGRAAAKRPASMLTTSTHDTKLSEDVRARLWLLSEIPERWGQAVACWSAINARHRRAGAPDRSDEYLFYQTLVGAWPLQTDRAVAHMRKAAREAKTHTSGLAPDSAYERALEAFVRDALGDRTLVEEIERFVAPLILPGRTNALSQTLLKLTAPGVPDIYQGTELWELSLADPDNRRPVDFKRRIRLLAELKALSVKQVMERLEEGIPKLWLIWKALGLRRRLPDAFVAGAGYQPLAAAGGKAEHVVAFLRGGSMAVVVPHLVLSLAGRWDDTVVELPSGRWGNVLDAERGFEGRALLSDLLGSFPVALLTRQ